MNFWVGEISHGITERDPVGVLKEFSVVIPEESPEISSGVIPFEKRRENTGEIPGEFLGQIPGEFLSLITGEKISEKKPGDSLRNCLKIFWSNLMTNP